MDAIRKQLDALMGTNRNGDVQEVKRRYYDRDVCRYYLAGLCPHDLFQLTRMDLGPCQKVHSLQLRKEYDDAKRDNYDRELEDCLEKHIQECDRKIQKCLKRLNDDSTAIAVSEVTKSAEASEYTRQIQEKLKEAEYFDLEGKTEEKARIMEQVEELRSNRADRQALSLLEAFNKTRPPLLPSLIALPPHLMHLPPDARTQEMIKEKLRRAEELGEQGMVDEAQKSLEEAEALKKLVPRQDNIPSDPSKQLDQKLRVCDICGAYLSIYDSDRRLADHFGGKLHLGYMRIREKLSDLREAREKARKERIPEVEERPRDRAISRERERDVEGERLRGDRDRYMRNQDRRDRGRGNRDYHRRSRSKSPSNDRMRERSRERSPRRPRERERDRY